MKLFITLILLLFCFVNFSFSKTNSDTISSSKFPDDTVSYNGTHYIYSKPKPFRFLKNIPKDFVDFSKNYFTKKNIPNIIGLTVGTVALVVMDQPLIDNSKKVGTALNIDGESGQKTYIHFKLFSLSFQDVYVQFNGPHDLSSAMYFIGDGWTHIAIGASYLTYGLIKKDNRALQAASCMAETMVAVGTAVQFLKHTTGRESPFVATVPGGKWTPLPNQIEYSKNVPHYDAYPSGHIATAMATVTVMAELYPEYNYIRPVGYSLMGVLMFAMLNNGVHWASDYPLGIALGYGFAKVAVNKSRKKIENTSTTSVLKKDNSFLKAVEFTPIATGYGVGMRMKF